MSSYQSIFLNGREVFSYRNQLRPEALSIFAKEDLRVVKGSESLNYAQGNFDIGELDPDEIETMEVILYKLTSQELRDRLDVLGCGMRSVEADYRESLASHINYLKDVIEPPPGRQTYPSLAAKYRVELERYSALTFDAWRVEVSAHVANKLESNQRNASDLRNLGPLALFEYVDARTALRLIAESADPDDSVEVEVTELYEDGWGDRDFDGSDFEYGLPIIITEGKFDAHAIEGALELLRPHLVGCLRFFDFHGNEGGAVAALKMMRSFAAAGVSNRILVLLDNDSAAHEAALALKGVELPERFRKIHYPALQIARDYPTLGPQGEAAMDVNGLAGSIELYLGRDVLTDNDGQLSPVQWKGYMAKVKAYQGEVIAKAAVQKAFDKKLEMARQDRSAISSQDWSGLEEILDAMVSALR